MKRIEQLEWSKVLKTVRNDSIICRRTAAVRDVPADLGDVESIATEKIAEMAPIQRIKSNRMADTQEKEVQRRKSALKVEQFLARVHQK